MLLRSAAVAAIALASLAGCNPNPFCLNCDPGFDRDGFVTDDGMQSSQGDGTDVETGDMTGSGFNLDLGDAGHCTSDLLRDPYNCGRCGNVCTYANAGGRCDNGVCVMGPCQPNWYDHDHAQNPDNGCEYSCTPTSPSKCSVDKDCPFGLPCNSGSCIKTCQANVDCPGGTICDPDTHFCEGEFCDGVDNNCDGNIDEGFDFKTDVFHCGGCGTVCNPPNAVPTCSAGACAIGMCKLDAKGGRFYNLNNNPIDGCEYDCTVEPPKAETCNGVDDDCNGIIDDSPVDVGAACDMYCPPLAACVGNKNCAAQLSACTGKCCGACTQGKTICAGGKQMCLAGTGPMLEVCNGVDDNCDGQIDEGYDTRTDPLNCGQCGNACMYANGIAGCANSTCVILACKPGFADVDKNPKNGCEYTCPTYPPGVESCNGVDDDCNGLVDDALQLPMNFMCVQTGPCAGAKAACGGAKGWICNYQQINAKIEVDKNGNLAMSEKLCDGFDGDCNGKPDDSFTNLGKVCIIGQGACAGQATWICDPNDATKLSCPAQPDASKAVDELCNGVDDDCDGVIDENTDGPGMCKDPNNGMMRACKGWHDLAVKVGNQWVYQYESSRTDAKVNAAGTAAGRSCSRPVVLPWSPVTETAAAAACALALDGMNQPLHLCDAATWEAACNIGVAPPKQVWSYAMNNTTYQPMACNGADANVNAAWATGSGASCYSAQANNAGNIFDMSGNVAEWTRTQVMYNNQTYYKVRGGAYNNPAGGLSCNFDFVIENANYQFSDLGFRCCADNQP